MTGNRITIEFATKVYLIVLISSLLWCLLIILAPLFQSLGGVFREISNFIYLFYSPVCHQDDARSFFVFGNKLAVCARCSALYFSFLAGLLAYPFVKRISDVSLPSVWFLVGGSALMLTDVLLDILDIHKNTHLTRAITGFVLGIILVFYILPGFINFCFEVYSFLKFDKNSNIINEQQSQ